jgi:regulator of CtrA degradation
MLSQCVAAWQDDPMLASRFQVTDKLVDALYTEAMLLADEARSYFDSVGRDDRAAMAPLARVTFSCESLKVTTRLMHVVAWLLARRNGTPDQDQALNPLSAAASSDVDVLVSLPEEARAIILASADLYDRVVRLQQQFGKPLDVSPVLGLQNRLARAF